MKRRVRGRAVIAGAALLLLSTFPARALVLPDVKRIFETPLPEGTRPAAGRISPDETTVAYFWNSEGLPRPLNLYIVPARGGKAKRLTSFTSRRPERRKTTWPMPDPGVFVEFSPDSKRILFGYDGDLFVAAVDGSEVERLTRTDATEGEATWSPDGRSILYTSGGALFRMFYPRAGTIQITSPEEGTSHGMPRWSPGGGKILFVAEQGKDQHDFPVPYYLDEWVSTKTSKRGMSQHRVGFLSPDGGDPVWVDPGAEPIWWLNDALWSPDGSRILLDICSKDLKTRTLLVTDAVPAPPPRNWDGREEEPAVSPPVKKDEITVRARVLYSETDPKWAYTFDGFVTDTTSTAFSPDDSRVLFTSERSGFNHAYVVPVAGGEPRAVTAGDWAVDWAAWRKGGERVIYLGNEGDPARRALRVAPTGAGRATLLEHTSTYITQPILSKRGGLLLFEGSATGVPFDYYVADTYSGKSVRVTDTVPRSFGQMEMSQRLPGEDSIPAKGWVLPRVVSFPSRDGKTLKGLLYENDIVVLEDRAGGDAPGRNASRRPVVVFVHGAGIQQNVVEGWTHYSPNFKFATVLVRHGFVVFEVDYRGSTGYGREFRTDVAGHLGGKDLEDELAGVEFLKTLPFVDPARIGIYGGSYGGFMAEMALFEAPGTFAAGAALRPVADWANYYRGNPWYCIQRLGTLEENPEAYRRSSPINFSERLQDPLLLLHGVLDSNVGFQDTVQLTDRLQRQGKSFELMIYPREDHGFTEPENWIDEYSRILDFFERHLKP
ncbi:MAG TPA: prolyl oligopeptidase family serine peptidase [Candidatus Polarisedimenticolia bacterium]|nr:prolyl oligopeptidase family serine peptidase [Candidatus Polarisedimenticolia bacterium]